MKKLILGLAVTSALGLAGCSDSPKEPEIPDSTRATRVSPLYAPGSGQLPLPNDLLFSGTENLTLNIPVPEGEENNYSNPSVALSSLDGWSATAPFSFKFADDGINDGGADVDITPGTVIPGTTVRMYQVNTLRGEAVPGTGIPVPTGPVTGVVSELIAGVDFVATYAGPQTVAVIPLHPLTEQASYMVVVTNGITDANGNQVVADVQYGIVKAEEPIPPSSGSAGLEPVRQLVNAMENAADAAGQPKEDIVMSFQFTVQSVGDVIATTKLAFIDAPFAAGVQTPSSFSSLLTDTAPFTGLGAADLYKGQVALNYFLTAPDSLANQGHPGVADPKSVKNDFFRGVPAFPNAADPANPIPNPFAGDVTTYANKLAAPTGVETVPLLVSMPKVALGCTKPEAGYPVMIFQHGITSNRTAMLGIADTMAAPPTCTAVVSMDLPIHGIDENNPVHLGLQAASGGLIGLFEDYEAGGVRERTFGVDYLPVAEVPGEEDGDDIPDPSGAHTINLSNLLVSRDNGRQAILDLLALEKAVPFMDIDGDEMPDFDMTNIKFMGHSLGGIIGTGFIGHSDLIESAVLANPSGGIALMLDASPTFGPVIRAGLEDVGVEPGSADYASFLFVTQTVVDSMDPASTSAFAVANGVPTLLIQAAEDTVIPNLVPTAPQSGTTPLSAFLATTPVSTDAAGFVAGDRLFTRFNAGLHSTVLSPFDAGGSPTYLDYTTEMQTHIASFLSQPSDAKGILVVDPTLLIQ